MRSIIATLAAVAFLLPTQPVAQDAVLRLYLARHGETDWNRDRRLQGSADIPLNDTGQQQAAALAARLSDIHLDAVYSSELRRSRDTAAIVHGAVPLQALAGLNERRLGTFEGRVGNSEYERRRSIPDDTLDGGESLTQFFLRVESTVSVLLQRHQSGAILIVGHGGTNQMIVRALFHLSAEQAARFEQANDDLYLCEIVSGSAKRFWRLTQFTR